MKRDENWTSPQAVLKAIGRRSVNIATKEENDKHRELRNQLGTPENNSHTRVVMFGRRNAFKTL